MASRQELGKGQLLESIVASSDEAILSKTLDGTITSWNPAAERLYRYTAAEAIGKNVKMLAPDKDHEAQIDDILRRVGRGEKIAHEVTERRTKDGRVVRVSITVSPVLDKGEIVGASIIAHEVTATERELAEMRAMMQAAVAQAAQTEILSKRVHDLKNEVIPIAAGLEGLLDAVDKLVTSEDVDERMTHLENTVNEDISAQLGELKETVNTEVQRKIKDNADRLLSTMLIGILLAVLIAGGLFYYQRVTACYSRNTTNQVLRDIVNRSESQNDEVDQSKLSPETRKVLAEFAAASPPRTSSRSFDAFVRKQTPIRGHCYFPF